MAPSKSMDCPITGYTVWLNSTQDVTLTAFPLGANATSITIRTLFTDRLYYANVTASNGYGTGPPSLLQAGVPKQLSIPPPEGVLGSNATSNSVLVSWLPVAVTNCTIDGVTNSTVTYTVYGYSKAGRQCNGNTTATQLNVTGLANGVLYYFTVTATVGDVTSVESQRSEYGCVTGSLPPQPPTRVWFTTTAFDKVTVSWSPPILAIDVAYYVVSVDGDALPSSQLLQVDATQSQVVIAGAVS